MLSSPPDHNPTDAGESRPRKVPLDVFVREALEGEDGPPGALRTTADAESKRRGRDDLDAFLERTVGPAIPEPGVAARSATHAEGTSRQVRLAVSPSLWLILFLVALAALVLAGAFFFNVFGDRLFPGSAATDTPAQQVQTPPAAPATPFVVDVNGGESQILFLVQGSQVYRSTRLGAEGSWERVLTLETPDLNTIPTP